jgi:hypothetical protein
LPLQITTATNKAQLIVRPIFSFSASIYFENKRRADMFFFRFNDWWLKDIFIIEVVNHHCCGPLILESLKAGTKAGGNLACL